MNTWMGSLSVQLAIYSAAWLVLALGFRVKKDATVLWSLGWLSAAASTTLLFTDGLGGLVRMALVQNALVVLSFVLLQKGAEQFGSYPPRRWDFVPLFLLLGIVQWLTTQGPAVYPWRVGIFTVTVSYPLVMTALHILAWTRNHAVVSNTMAAIVTAPIGLTLAVFWMRAALVFSGTPEGTVDFAHNTAFDVAASAILQVVLAAFNFSLASLLLGSLIERLRELSATDQLTDLPNRRVMMHRLTQEHARYLRSHHGYSVVMMDLDYFKKINDSYGHTVGDQVLQAVARLLQDNLRTSDTLARFGGEEFMLLMPLTDTDGALVQARRIRDRIAASPVHTDAGALQVTMSLGVAESFLTDPQAAAVIRRADAALYQAKARGRNTVEAAERQALPS